MGQRTRRWFRESRLAADIASDYVTLTPTTDAFRHIASLARERLTIMVRYIDLVGAEWAAEVFEGTTAAERTLVVGMLHSLPGVGPRDGGWSG